MGRQLCREAIFKYISQAGIDIYLKGMESAQFKVKELVREKMKDL